MLNLRFWQKYGKTNANFQFVDFMLTLNVFDVIDLCVLRPLGIFLESSLTK